MLVCRSGPNRRRPGKRLLPLPLCTTLLTIMLPAAALFGTQTSCCWRCVNLDAAGRTLSTSLPPFSRLPSPLPIPPSLHSVRLRSALAAPSPLLHSCHPPASCHPTRTVFIAPPFRLTARRADEERAESGSLSWAQLGHPAGRVYLPTFTLTNSVYATRPHITLYLRKEAERKAWGRGRG